MAIAPGADITVTTATQSEAEVRADLGLPAKEASIVPAVPADPKPAEAVVAPEVDEEATSDKPDESISEAGRTLRRSRFDERKKQRQGELDALTKQTADATRELERIKAETAVAQRPPAEPTPKPAASAQAGAVFTFPEFEQWQEDPKNADKTYTAYIDERVFAANAFDRQLQADNNARVAANQQERATYAALVPHVEAFKATHPDYDAVTNTVKLPIGADGKLTAQAVALQNLALETGASAPAITYYLAKHPDVLQQLLSASKPSAQARLFGQIELKATEASAPAATTTPAGAAAPPAKPTTAAPAPLTQVNGDAATSRTLASLAADSDDADDYIARRRQQMGLPPSRG